MTKRLISSLLRTHFSGEVIAFRNGSRPLFDVPRLGVTEVFVDTSDVDDLADFATRFKAQARTSIDRDRYNKLIFVDCNCLAFRNVDHRFDGSDTMIG